MEKERIRSSRLGKGLASLFPSASPPPPPTSTVPNDPEESISNKDRILGISMCSIHEIQPNQFQPRKQFDETSIDELASSISLNGLIQPLIVRRVEKGYELIAGERRWRAAKKAGLEQVPIVIRKTTNRESLELAIIENIQREDLNCVDTALAYQQLIHDFDLTQEEVSSRVGKDRASVANHLRLLKLPEFARNALESNRISFGHGRALVGLEDSKLIEKFVDEIIDKKWSVRELETQIQRIKNLQGHGKKMGEALLDPLQLRLRNLGRDLSKKFGTKVQLRGKEERGKIVIEYFNKMDLERVLDSLLK